MYLIARKPIPYLWGFYILLIITASLVPGSNLPEMDVSDKLLHLAGYIPLGIFPLLALRDTRSIVSAVALMIILGAILEFAQIFVPGRYFSLGDILANSIGVIFGYLGGMSYLRKSTSVK